MKQHALTEIVTLPCKIVEIYDRDGKSYARVSLSPCCIEVLADPALEFHLGEKVTVDAQIKTTAIRPASTLAE
jgi:hypothetical protein